MITTELRRRQRIRRALAWILATIVGAAGFGLLRPPSPEGEPRTVAAPVSIEPVGAPQPAERAPGTLRPHPTAAQAASARAVADEAAATLHQQFLRSTNYREFVRVALQRPEVGGRLYARMAFFRCTQAATTARVWQEKHGGGSGEGRTALEHDAARALQAVLAACEGLDEQFGGTSPLMALMINGGQRVQDPHLALVNRMAHDRQDQMAQARQLGDPLVVSEALLLALSRDLQRDPLLFGESGVDARRAAEVITCELMGTCTSSLRAISGCLLEGCFSLDLRVEIRARHLTHPKQFEELVRRIKSRYLVG